ncbi:hypothetical protein BD626DRAFT_181841 [Schizophyllum amplum]|uniref:OTU domain-containing protein n=1 Tax=Schizophyllum amplum TaxID=97359 RepID=A0A550C1H1_9AGAR|nr:hypothetical protein BD626DRAFT_181841 [Auriculariopsis ampla]
MTWTRSSRPRTRMTRRRRTPSSDFSPARCVVMWLPRLLTYIRSKARKAQALQDKLSPSDPDADARLEREAKDEEKAIQKLCGELGVEMYEINPDGHCLFSAVADQLNVLGILPKDNATYVFVRDAAAKYMFNHPDDFLPFLPSVSGEDGAGAGDAGFMSPRQFEQYCATIRETGAWGGEPEILALSRSFNIPIHVIQHGQPPVVMHHPKGEAQDGDLHSKGVVRISYHRRMYGLGEHYNSLRPKRSLSDKLHDIIS